LIEEARLDPVNGLGVGKMVDKINETRRDGDLAHEFALIPAGYGRDLREILRLQGDGLGGQFFAEFLRQRFRQIAAPIQRDAEAAGIRLGRGGGLAGDRQGGGEKSGCNSGFHFSNLSTVNCTPFTAFSTRAQFGSLLQASARRANDGKHVNRIRA
jgi:hypothetical protein